MIESIIDFVWSKFVAMQLWFEAHPWASAILVGIVVAILLTQWVKPFYPARWSRVFTKRVSQLLSGAIGFVVTFSMWPFDADHGVVSSTLSGAASPLVYLAFKRWLLPNLMRRWGWTALREKKVEAQASAHE